MQRHNKKTVRVFEPYDAFDNRGPAAREARRNLDDSVPRLADPFAPADLFDPRVRFGDNYLGDRLQPIWKTEDWFPVVETTYCWNRLRPLGGDPPRVSELADSLPSRYTAPRLAERLYTGVGQGTYDPGDKFGQNVMRY